MDQLTEQLNLDIYDEIINIKKEMMKNIFKEKYNLYRIDIKIDEIIDNIFNSDIDFKIDPKYEKEIPKMIREKGRLRPNRCIARKWNGGYGVIVVVTVVMMVFIVFVFVFVFVII